MRVRAPLVVFIVLRSMKAGSNVAFAADPLVRLLALTNCHGSCLVSLDLVVDLLEHIEELISADEHGLRLRCSESAGRALCVRLRGSEQVSDSDSACLWRDWAEAACLRQLFEFICQEWVVRELWELTEWATRWLFHLLLLGCPSPT